MSIEDLSIEEELYEDRRRFYRTQQWLRVTKYSMLTLIAGSTCYVITLIVMIFGYMNEMQFWTRPSAVVKANIMNEGFDLFILFMIVLFNCVGFFSTISESFSLTVVYVFGTTMTLIMSFFTDSQHTWSAGHRLPLVILRALLLTLGLVYFFLMRQRRVTS